MAKRVPDFGKDFQAPSLSELDFGYSHRNRTFLPLLQSQGHRVLAGDLSTDMIKQSDEQFYGYVLCDAEACPFQDEAVDYILSIRFFHHLPEIAAMSVLKEFRRVCRCGIIAELPLIQPATPLIMAGCKVLKSKRVKQENADIAVPLHLFPTSAKRFRALIEILGFEMSFLSSVTWSWGQTKICLLEKTRVNN